MPPRPKKRKIKTERRVPCLAERPNRVWSYDFQENVLLSGRKIRLLNVLDEFTREWLSVTVGVSLNGGLARHGPQDKSCRPNRIGCAFDPSQPAMILSLHKKDLPLDDLLDLVQQPLTEASRSSVYRLLNRCGVSRLPKQEEQETGRDDKHGQFKDYGPGFVHMDCFYLPKLEGKKRYCLVAVKDCH